MFLIPCLPSAGTSPHVDEADHTEVIPETQIAQPLPTQHSQGTE